MEPEELDAAVLQHVNGEVEGCTECAKIRKAREEAKDSNDS